MFLLTNMKVSSTSQKKNSDYKVMLQSDKGNQILTGSPIHLRSYLHNFPKW